MKKGIIASTGYAIGYVAFTDNEEAVDVKIETLSPELEKENLEKAVDLSRGQIIKLKDKTKCEMGEKEAAVFDSHIMFLEDPEFVGAAITLIEEEKFSAEKAMLDITNKYLEVFSNIEDEYMRERADDIRDVYRRITRNLKGKAGCSINCNYDNVVVVTHDLTPSDTAELDKSKVVAFLTDIGGKTSHSSIMARTMGIPSVVGLKDITSSVAEGDLVIVDGVRGEVIINPDERTLKLYKQKIEEFNLEREKLKKIIYKKTVTREGKTIVIAGNIGAPEDVDAVIENGGEGIGLFRTEFLYMNRDTMPNEEEQFEAYKNVVEKMSGKVVIIRTLDIGGDKKLSYLPMESEMNPFLGYRAIRICLDRKDIFKIQLRALLRASNYGNLQIMFPMISSLEELLEAKGIIKECMVELDCEGTPYNKEMKIGIMIEIPSAAIMADELAKHVDFFSIGTNDLIQYTLAADRMNEKVSYLYNAMHPAVLRLIKMTIDAAHKEGIWCGMCGEMAAYEKAIPTLLEYGLDEFSMSATSILKAKKIIINN